MTPFTLAHQAPLSMEFSRQGYWSGLPIPSPGDLPHPETEPCSPSLQADSLPESPGEAIKLSPNQFLHGSLKWKLVSPGQKKMLMSSKTCSSPVPSSEMASLCSGVRKPVSLCWVWCWWGRDMLLLRWALARICWVSGMVFFTHLSIPCPAVFKRYDWFDSGSILLTQMMLP